MNRALITGGLGFIGRALADRLAEVGWEAHALDSLNPQIHDDPNASRAAFAGEAQVGDVRNLTTVRSAIRGCDMIFHLAAETGVGQSMYEVERYEQTNVVGTEVVAREARDRGVPLINMSSRAVYGRGAWSCPLHTESYGACCEHSLPRPSREGDRLDPCSVYGETKVRAEAEVVRLACRDWPALSLRPQNVVGAGQATHNPYTGVLAAFSAKLRAGLPPVVYGDGTQTRDFVHVDDVVNTLTWLAQHVERWPSSGALNVGTGQRTTIRHLAEIALALRPIGETRIEYVDVVRTGDIEHACADLALSQAIGAPQAERGTEQAVADFLSWAETRERVPADIWDTALDELRERGLLS